MIIAAADRIIDGHGSHAESDDLIDRAEKLGMKTSTLEIVSLAKRWEDKLPSRHYKSGASAMAAIKMAKSILASGAADVILIKGEDALRSGYTKTDRDRFMRLYGGRRFTPLDGYTRLVPDFLRCHGITAGEFKAISEALFENYYKTWKGLHPDAKRPDPRWFENITKFFRGVDCANPNIDFSGQLVITGPEHATRLGLSKRVRILGNAFTKLRSDGFASIPEVVPYLHLKRVIDQVICESEVDFKKEFLKGHALLEAYTCYPVVPMGLLLRLGLVDDLRSIPDFLERHDVTITGGMNLAKAPWNLTSLNHVIAMRNKLMGGGFKYGLIHGNGSLGNQQGITLLGVDR